MGKPRNIAPPPADARYELDEEPDADEGHGRHIDDSDEDEDEDKGLHPRTRELQYVCPEYRGDRAARPYHRNRG